MCFYEGREYGSDLARIINKFDVYICDLNDVAEGSAFLNKRRPCVVMSSDAVNCPKANMYLVAPIRTEHTNKVSKDTLNSIVAERRKLGRVYVPIEVEPGDYRFIDMTQLRPVESKQLQHYKATIINEKLKKQINLALIETLMTESEFEDVVDIVTAPTVKKVEDEKAQPKHEEKKPEVKPVVTVKETKPEVKPVVTAKETKPEVKPVDVKAVPANKPTGRQDIKLADIPKETFTVLYAKYKNGEISVSEAARKLNTTADILYKRIKEYEKALKCNKVYEPNMDGYPEGFYEHYKMFKNGKISVKKISEKTGRKSNSIYYYIKKFEKENPSLVIK